MLSPNWYVLIIFVGTSGLGDELQNLDTKNDSIHPISNDIKELLMIVRIKYLNNRSVRYCSGILILPDIILTTAVCGQHHIKEVYQHSVVLFEKSYGKKTGKHPSEGTPVNGYAVPDSFLLKQNGIRDNIALLFLEYSSVLVNKVGELVLPTSNQINEPCFSSTWHNLSVHLIPIVSNDMCQTQLLATNKLDVNFQVDATEMCVLGDEFIDVVHEDGGTPLVCASGLNDGRYVLIGLASWSMGHNTSLPMIFTRVWTYMDWIRDWIFKD